MRIVTLSTQASWVGPFVESLIVLLQKDGHETVWSHESADYRGDVCFLLSWERVVTAEFRSRFRHTLVVHAADLPRGRGWSPLSWQILEGRHNIVVSLIAAADPVDSGEIYGQEHLTYTGTELLDELQKGVGNSTVTLCIEFVRRLVAGALTSRPQVGEPTWYPKRRPADSRLDPEKSIASQFDLLRIVDNERYPAFFEIRGRRYNLKISAADGNESVEKL